MDLPYCKHCKYLFYSQVESDWLCEMYAVQRIGNINKCDERYSPYYDYDYNYDNDNYD